MSRVKGFVEQFRRIHDGDAWHGASLHEALAGITSEQATARPIPDAHTIWELVAHIAAWEGVLRRWMEGTPVSGPEEGDFPATPSPTADAWKNAIGRLDASHEEFVGSIARLPEAALDQTVVGKTYSIGFMLEGAIRHHVYHCGQIALLKKSVVKA